MKLYSEKVKMYQLAESEQGKISTNTSMCKRQNRHISFLKHSHFC